MEPLRNTVLSLKKDTTTLADCFIMLVQLAVKINKISHESATINFKNHCIGVMNTRWNSVELSPYILSYWLHPTYRGKFKILRLFNFY